MGVVDALGVLRELLTRLDEQLQAPTAGAWRCEDCCRRM
jgi:hypothetical protein